MKQIPEHLREQIRDILERLQLDAVLITDPVHMRYLSGFSGGEGLLFISRERAVLITDSRYTEAAGKESAFEIVEENRGHRREEILKELIAKGAQIGFEDRTISYAEWKKWKELLQDIAHLLPIHDEISRLRQIKTKTEISLLRRAEEIGDLAFADFIAWIHAGVTEKEAAAELEYRMRQHGADGFSFDTIMASGMHTSMPHAVPGDKVIQKGELLTLDFGCIYHGYCSDMTRTIAIGEPGAKEKEIYEIVLQAQKHALAAIRPGIPGSEPDSAARSVIESAGYGAYFGHGTGHSVGLLIHEEPRLSPNETTILQSGMIETVEPGIYLPGQFGVRIEDMVLVTEDGYENLSHSPKEWLVIE